MTPEQFGELRENVYRIRAREMNALQDITASLVESGKTPDEANILAYYEYNKRYAEQLALDIEVVAKYEREVGKMQAIVSKANEYLAYPRWITEEEKEIV